MVRKRLGESSTSSPKKAQDRQNSPERPQFGSYDESIYKGQFSGSAGALRYSFGYDRVKAENDYRVPVGAANRGADGRLFNGDVTKDNYFGNFTLDLNARNSLSLDAPKITSRRGLLYFGFPLQRDRSRTTGGVGLGLSIVQAIVRAHGGKIQLQSAVSKGSTFTIRFPLRNVGTSEKPPAD